MAIPILFLAAAVSGAGIFHTTADLRIGEAQTVALPSGESINVRLVAVHEEKDPVQEAIREARVDLLVNGSRVTVSCANYALPVATGGMQVDCPVTGGYRANTSVDHWGLRADARVRIWPGGSAWLADGEMGYPLRQRWFLTHTQMANEPVYVNREELRTRKKIYYHSGLDLGGAEALAEVVAATDGQIVSLAGKVLDGHEKGTPVAPRYDVLYLRDKRGWYYRYSHLYSFEKALVLGAEVKRGQLLGRLGKEGGSGGWSHLHFEIVARQPSGEWGTEEGYAFLWEAYRRDRQPDVVAMARPHRYARVGEEVALDGSRSWVRAGRASFRWRLSDGRDVSTAAVRMRYDRPGSYSEVLEVTDGLGHTAYDFATVVIYGDVDPVMLNASFSPGTDPKAGQAIQFRARTFGTDAGEETWDFGDGSPRQATRSDGNREKLAKDGYARIEHTYRKRGDYIVTIRNGHATTHLWVPVR